MTCDATVLASLYWEATTFLTWPVLGDSFWVVFPVVSIWGQSCYKNRGRNAGRTHMAASRWVEEEWHFWMGLRTLSLLISPHSTPYTACITHPMWLGGGADKMNKSAGREPGKNWRWPGRFVWVGCSVIIMHDCLSQHAAENCGKRKHQASIGNFRTLPN